MASTYSSSFSSLDMDHDESIPAATNGNHVDKIAPPPPTEQHYSSASTFSDLEGDEGHHQGQDEAGRTPQGAVPEDDYSSGQETSSIANTSLTNPTMLPPRAPVGIVGRPLSARVSSTSRLPHASAIAPVTITSPTRTEDRPLDAPRHGDNPYEDDDDFEVYEDDSSDGDPHSNTHIENDFDRAEREYIEGKTLGEVDKQHSSSSSAVVVAAAQRPPTASQSRPSSARPQSASRGRPASASPMRTANASSPRAPVMDTPPLAPLGSSSPISSPTDNGNDIASIGELKGEGVDAIHGVGFGRTEYAVPVSNADDSAETSEERALATDLTSNEKERPNMASTEKQAEQAITEALAADVSVSVSSPPTSSRDSSSRSRVEEALESFREMAAQSATALLPPPPLPPTSAESESNVTTPVTAELQPRDTTFDAMSPSSSSSSRASSASVPSITKEFNTKLTRPSSAGTELPATRPQSALTHKLAANQQTPKTATRPSTALHSRTISRRAPSPISNSPPPTPTIHNPPQQPADTSTSSPTTHHVNPPAISGLFRSAAGNKSSSSLGGLNRSHSAAIVPDVKGPPKPRVPRLSKRAQLDAKIRKERAESAALMNLTDDGGSSIRSGGMGQECGADDTSAAKNNRKSSTPLAPMSAEERRARILAAYDDRLIAVAARTANMNQQQASKHFADQSEASRLFEQFKSDSQLAHTFCDLMNELRLSDANVLEPVDTSQELTPKQLYAICSQFVDSKRAFDQVQRETEKKIHVAVEKARRDALDRKKKEKESRRIAIEQKRAALLASTGIAGIQRRKKEYLHGTSDKSPSPTASKPPGGSQDLSIRASSPSAAATPLGSALVATLNSSLMVSSDDDDDDSILRGSSSAADSPSSTATSRRIPPTLASNVIRDRIVSETAALVKLKKSTCGVVDSILQREARIEVVRKLCEDYSNRPKFFNASLAESLVTEQIDSMRAVSEVVVARIHEWRELMHEYEQSRGIVGQWREKAIKLREESEREAIAASRMNLSETPANGGGSTQLFTDSRRGSTEPSTRRSSLQACPMTTPIPGEIQTPSQHLHGEASSLAPLPPVNPNLRPFPYLHHPSYIHKMQKDLMFMYGTALGPFIMIDVHNNVLLANRPRRIVAEDSRPDIASGDQVRGASMSFVQNDAFGDEKSGALLQQSSRPQDSFTAVTKSVPASGARRATISPSKASYQQILLQGERLSSSSRLIATSPPPHELLQSMFIGANTTPTKQRPRARSPRNTNGEGGDEDDYAPATLTGTDVPPMTPSQLRDEYFFARMSAPKDTLQIRRAAGHRRPELDDVTEGILMNARKKKGHRSPQEVRDEFEEAALDSMRLSAEVERAGNVWFRGATSKVVPVMKKSRGATSKASNNLRDGLVMSTPNITYSSNASIGALSAVGSPRALPSTTTAAGMLLAPLPPGRRSKSKDDTNASLQPPQVTIRQAALNALGAKTSGVSTLSSSNASSPNHQRNLSGVSQGVDMSTMWTSTKGDLLSVSSSPNKAGPPKTHPSSQVDNNSSSLPSANSRRPTSALRARLDAIHQSSSVKGGPRSKGKPGLLSVGPHIDISRRLLYVHPMDRYCSVVNSRLHQQMMNKFSLASELGSEDLNGSGDSEEVQSDTAPEHRRRAAASGSSRRIPAPSGGRVGTPVADISRQGDDARDERRRVTDSHQLGETPRRGRDTSTLQLSAGYAVATTSSGVGGLTRKTLDEKKRRSLTHTSLMRNLKKLANSHRRWWDLCFTIVLCTFWARRMRRRVVDARACRKIQRWFRSIIRRERFIQLSEKAFVEKFRPRVEHVAMWWPVQVRALEDVEAMREGDADFEEWHSALKEFLEKEDTTEGRINDEGDLDPLHPIVRVVGLPVLTLLCIDPHRGDKVLYEEEMDIDMHSLDGSTRLLSSELSASSPLQLLNLSGSLTMALDATPLHDKEKGVEGEATVEPAGEVRYLARGAQNMGVATRYLLHTVSSFRPALPLSLSTSPKNAVGGQCIISSSSSLQPGERPVDSAATNFHSPPAHTVVAGAACDDNNRSPLIIAQLPPRSPIRSKSQITISHKAIASDVPFEASIHAPVSAPPDQVVTTMGGRRVKLLTAHMEGGLGETGTRTFRLPDDDESVTEHPLDKHAIYIESSFGDSVTSGNEEENVLLNAPHLDKPLPSLTLSENFIGGAPARALGIQPSTVATYQETAELRLARALRQSKMFGKARLLGCSLPDMKGNRFLYDLLREIMRRQHSYEYEVLSPQERVGLRRRNYLFASGAEALEMQPVHCTIVRRRMMWKNEARELRKQMRRDEIRETLIREFNAAKEEALAAKQSSKAVSFLGENESHHHPSVESESDLELDEDLLDEEVQRLIEEEEVEAQAKKESERLLHNSKHHRRSSAANSISSLQRSSLCDDMGDFSVASSGDSEDDMEVEEVVTTTHRTSYYPFRAPKGTPNRPYRSSVIAVFFFLEECATKIQRSWRRSVNRAKMPFFIRRCHGIVRIQRFLRHHRQAVSLRKEIGNRVAVTTIRRVTYYFYCRRKVIAACTQHRCATIVRRAYLTSCAVAKLKRLRLERNSATTIQRNYRGYVGRCKATCARHCQVVMRFIHIRCVTRPLVITMMIHKLAAERIQRAVRCLQARNRVQRIKTLAEERLWVQLQIDRDSLYRKAISKIMGTYKGHTYRRDVVEEYELLHPVAFDDLVDPQQASLPHLRSLSAPIQRDASDTQLNEGEEGSAPSPWLLPATCDLRVSAPTLARHLHSPTPSESRGKHSPLPAPHASVHQFLPAFEDSHELLLIALSEEYSIAENKQRHFVDVGVLNEVQRVWLNCVLLPSLLRAAGGSAAALSSSSLRAVHKRMPSPPIVVIQCCVRKFLAACKLEKLRREWNIRRTYLCNWQVGARWLRVFRRKCALQAAVMFMHVLRRHQAKKRLAAQRQLRDDEALQERRFEAATQMSALWRGHRQRSGSSDFGPSDADGGMDDKLRVQKLDPAARARIELQHQLRFQKLDDATRCLQASLRWFHGVQRFRRTVQVKRRVSAIRIQRWWRDKLSERVTCEVRYEYAKEATRAALIIQVFFKAVVGAARARRRREERLREFSLRVNRKQLRKNVNN